MNDIIGPAIVGRDPVDQKGIDNFMVQTLDGTKNEWGCVAGSYNPPHFRNRGGGAVSLSDPTTPPNLVTSILRAPVVLLLCVCL